MIIIWKSSSFSSGVFFVHFFARCCIQYNSTGARSTRVHDFILTSTWHIARSFLSVSGARVGKVDSWDELRAEWSTGDKVYLKN